MADELSKEYTSRLKFLSIEEKLDFIQVFLAKEGFTIEWSKEEDHYTISATSCPYYHISHNHPEICSIDQNFISAMLSVPVSKVKCVLNGDTVCAYEVSQVETGLSQ